MLAKDFSVFYRMMKQIINKTVVFDDVPVIWYIPNEDRVDWVYRNRLQFKKRITDFEIKFKLCLAGRAELNFKPRCNCC